MSNAGASELERLLRQLRRYAEVEMPAQGSAIYAEICRGLADDPERAGLALLAQPAFRTPNVLLAAVHHLLLTGTDGTLGGYFPSVAGESARPADAALYDAFANFVDAHRQAIAGLVASRTTQTNEVGRSAVLLPLLALVEAESARPLALLEVGASAGLNLLPDRYRYRYGATRVGDASAVQLDCEPKGSLVPRLPARPPSIAWRRGLDRNPLSVEDDDAMAWLRALVWPEHLDRMQRLRAAVAIARRQPPVVLRGDVVDDLPRLAASAPADAELVITSTSVLAYLDRPGIGRFLDAVRSVAAGLRRTVWLAASEGQSVLGEAGLGIAPPDLHAPDHALTLHRFEPDTGEAHTLLAICHAHGRWIRWLDPASGGSPA